MIDIREHEIFDTINHQLDRLDRASPAGKILGQLIEALLKGRLEYDVVWDDLRAPATSINPPGQVSDPDVDLDGTLLFDSVGIEQTAIIMQMPHTWKEESYIIPHLHWSKTTDAANDVVWEYRYRIFNVGDIAPSWSAWIPRASRSSEPGSIQAGVMDIFPDLDMASYKISSILSMQVRRDPTATEDTYGADARLWEFDIHYQRDGLGSLESDLKGTV